jgi:hypothetical protein
MEPKGQLAEVYLLRIIVLYDKQIYKIKKESVAVARFLIKQIRRNVYSTNKLVKPRKALISNGNCCFFPLKQTL